MGGTGRVRRLASVAAMEASGATEEAVLTALRVSGSASTDELVRRTGRSGGELESLLARLASNGLARRRDEAPVGWSLTPAGRREAASVLATALDAAGARPVVESAYADFARLNPRLLDACTQWQVRTVDGTAVVNDHEDPAHDEAALAALEAVHAEVRPLLGELGGAVASFEGYGRRFDDAIGRVRAGDGRWFAHPLIDSYHTVWFELHEHLLASLGLDRSVEARTDTEPDGSQRPAAPQDAPDPTNHAPQPDGLPPTPEEAS